MRTRWCAALRHRHWTRPTPACGLSVLRRCLPHLLKRRRSTFGTQKSPTRFIAGAAWLTLGSRFVGAAAVLWIGALASWGLGAWAADALPYGPPVGAQGTAAYAYRMPATEPGAGVPALAIAALVALVALAVGGALRRRAGG